MTPYTLLHKENSQSLAFQAFDSTPPAFKTFCKDKKAAIYYITLHIDAAHADQIEQDMADLKTVLTLTAGGGSHHGEEEEEDLDTRLDAELDLGEENFRIRIERVRGAVGLFRVPGYLVAVAAEEERKGEGLDLDLGRWRTRVLVQKLPRFG